MFIAVFRFPHFLPAVLYVTRSFGVIYDEYVVDQGKNLTLQCKSPYPVMWVHAGRRDGDFQQFQVSAVADLTPNVPLFSKLKGYDRSVPCIFKTYFKIEPHKPRDRSNGER